MVQVTEIQSPPEGMRAEETLTPKREQAKREPLPAPAAQRIVLHGIRWETYESLLEDLADSSAPRLTFDRGVLEIMSPLPKHERSNRIIATLVEVITEEWEQDIENLGSTTFRREDVERGFEPDSCFYIQNVERIRGKTEIDMTVDPPPDLLIEIDITHSCLPKLPIYAQFGVPEVWRYDGCALNILILESGDYQERGESVALPGLDRVTLSAFLQDSRTLRRTEWLRRLREWARSQLGPGDAPH
jgi:Uma2 family endonuclease